MSASDGPLTRYALRGSAAWVTLDSPANRNALSAGLVAELRDQLERGFGDPAARCLVLTGSGKAFCAGADLKNRGEMGDRGHSGRNPLVDVLELLAGGGKPTLAAVNGPAFGGGVGLVAACDLAIAAESARFAFSEVRLGLVPAMISVVVVPKLGVSQATRLFLTGERFDAARAVDYGLVHRAVPAAELEAAVDAEVRALAQGGPVALAEAKELVRTVARLPRDAAFAWAQRRIDALFASEEAAEGMAAFAERRRPRWAPPED